MGTQPDQEEPGGLLIPGSSRRSRICLVEPRCGYRCTPIKDGHNQSENEAGME